MQRTRIYFWQTKYAAALRELNAAMVFGGYNLAIVSARASLHMTNTKDYRKAARDLERATELAPDNQGNWYNLAVAYYRIKDCKTVAATKRYIVLCSPNHVLPATFGAGVDKNRPRFPREEQEIQDQAAPIHPALGAL